MGDNVKEASGIGSHAEQLRGYIQSTWANNDTKDYYSKLTFEVNPFQKDGAQPKTFESIELSDVFENRLKKILFDAKTGLHVNAFKSSSKPYLEEMQKLYTAEHKEFLAATKDVPAKDKPAAFAKFVKEFQEKKEFLILMETAKVDVTKMNAEKLAERAEKAPIDSALLKDPQRFVTPVIIPRSTENFDRTNRDKYMAMALKTTGVGEKKETSIVLVGDAVVNPPGQYVPPDKLFKEAMRLYDGSSDKHALLGSKTARRHADAYLDGCVTQVLAKQQIIERNGIQLQGGGEAGKKKYIELKEATDNFLRGVANLAPAANGEITLPKEVKIKDANVIKAIEKAFEKAKRNADKITPADTSTDEDGKKAYAELKARLLVEARMRALNEPETLKELLKAHGPAAASTAQAVDELFAKAPLKTLVDMKDKVKKDKIIENMSDHNEQTNIFMDFDALKKAIYLHYRSIEGMGKANELKDLVNPKEYAILAAPSSLKQPANLDLPPALAKTGMSF